MNNMIVRLEKVEITNFKNVRHGEITFENHKKSYNSSILGLYGQNGSGKTVLIDAIWLLKLALSGLKIPSYFADFINIDVPSAKLNYRFKIQDSETSEKYVADYEFIIEKAADESDSNIKQNNLPTKYKTVIKDEILSYSYESDEKKQKLQPVINTKISKVFGPTSKYKILVGSKKELITNLMSYKNLTFADSRSFIFSMEFLNILHQNCTEEYHWNLLESLVRYGNFELFVINGLNAMNMLPLPLKESDIIYSLGKNLLMINLNTTTLIPKIALNTVNKVVTNMNIVLSQLVPSLKIDLKNLGDELLQNGTTASKIQLVSQKNNREIPLQYESEGIKKIISILPLLILVYNNNSITVAIDELDSGVFEYLLGEILRIISEKGKGQLIFTSHNLRPLETIDRSFIAFTTTNPDKRYIRLTNLKTSNNLRDFYYRDIILGEQKEPLYDTTHNSEIAFALREAGK